MPEISGGQIILRNTLAALFGSLHVDDFLNPIIEHPYSRRRYQVLIYHKVSPDPHPFFPPTTPSDFEQQIVFLKQHYRVLDLEELIDRSIMGEIPKKAVAITFDDGYRDNYDFAFPILRKHDVTATIFLATSAIDNGQQLWHDRIFNSFRFSRNGSHPLILADVIRQAKSLPSKERLHLVEMVEETLTPEIPKEYRFQMLSWMQITEMRQAGVRFGSHTCTHPILAMEKPPAVMRELTKSKADIEERLDSPVSLLAYPNGQKSDYSASIGEAARKAGYKCAFTSMPGFNTINDSLYELKRGQPWQNDQNHFRLGFFLQRHFLPSGLHPTRKRNTEGSWINLRGYNKFWV